MFDTDDVLVHYGRSASVRYLASLSNRPLDEVADAIWGPGLEAKAGLIDSVTYPRETSDLIRCKVSIEDWLPGRRESMSAHLEVLAPAAAASRKCTIAVLTNNPRLVADNIAGLCPPIADLFGKNVFASFNAAKPSPETFLECIDSLGVAPSESLFVDDLEANVAGARNAGLFGQVFTEHTVLSEELRKHGLLDH